MYIEECLNCSKQYDTEYSSANKAILYCSWQCEQERAMEQEATYVLHTQDEFIY